MWWKRIGGFFGSRIWSTRKSLDADLLINNWNTRLSIKVTAFPLQLGPTSSTVEAGSDAYMPLAACGRMQYCYKPTDMQLVTISNISPVWKRIVQLMIGIVHCYSLRQLANETCEFWVRSCGHLHATQYRLIRILMPLGDELYVLPVVQGARYDAYIWGCQLSSTTLQIVRLLAAKF